MLEFNLIIKGVIEGKRGEEQIRVPFEAVRKIKAQTLVIGQVFHIPYGENDIGHDWGGKWIFEIHRIETSINSDTGEEVDMQAYCEGLLLTTAQINFLVKESKFQLFLKQSGAM